MGLGPGYAVSKHIRLVRLLGKGGMGSVWVADHLALKTRVAVKFMSDLYSGDPAMLTRFQREATSAAQIGSPHIVNVHDHGITADGVPYMVMELLDGEDLSSRVKRAAPLPLEDVAKIVSQTCKALGKAHRLGIVHRDIKPNNIFLVDAEGDIFVKVLDFGVAKPGGGESSEVTSTGAVVGTVIYASPEQLVNARSVDFRADLWSLGVVAYRAMTGKLPFSDANGIGALALAQIDERFVPPSRIVSDIPPEVDDWCKRAFKHDPLARFDSAREMANAFYTALGRTSSPSVTRTPPSRIKAPREPDADTVIERTAKSPSSSTDDTASSEVTKNPISLGAASAMTYVEQPTTNTSLPTRRRRRIFVVAAVLTSLLGAGALTFVLLKRIAKPHVEVSTRPIAAEASNATASPPASILTDTPVVPVSSRVELVTPPSAPSAAASSASASSAPASSAPAPSASAPDPKARSKQGGGSSRNPPPEKDYGF